MKKTIVLSALLASAFVFAQEPAAPTCECKDGKPCLCGDACKCGEKPGCECKDGKPCLCADACKCGEKPACECKDGRPCECGKPCKCGEKPACGKRPCGEPKDCRRGCFNGPDADVPRFVKCNCCPECKGLILLPPRGAMCGRGPRPDFKGGCGPKGPGMRRPPCGKNGGDCPRPPKAPEAPEAPEAPAPDVAE